MNPFILERLKEARSVIDAIFDDGLFLYNTESAINELSECYKNNGRVFSCGNGGSNCDSMHFAEELTGRFQKDRAPLPAQSISDPSHMTCVANDYGYEFIFSRYLEAWGNKGDILLAISTSGNSANVINAVKMAHQKEMRVIGLLGKGGGEMSDLVDIPLIVPETESTDRIQEIHIKLIHFFIEGIERKLFPENYS